MFKILSSLILIFSLNSFAYTYYQTYDYPKKKEKNTTNNTLYSKIKINNVTLTEGSYHHNDNTKNGTYILFNQDWINNKDYTEFIVNLNLIKSIEEKSNRDNLYTLDKKLEIFYKDTILILKIDGIQKEFEINHNAINQLKHYDQNENIFIQKEFRIKNYVFDLIFY